MCGVDKMKKIFLMIPAIIIILIGAGYFIGNYFVDFALKRDIETLSPPKATLDIADPNIKVPAEPDFEKEIWNVESNDKLKLCATYFLPKVESHQWAILVHGYGRDQRFAFDFAEEYLKHGYNVLTPDLRAAGESEGEYITMGNFESRDIILWTEKILERDPQAKIILHGVSMGAATVLMASGLNPKNFVAVVEDCGYTNAYEMFTMQLEEIFNLPEFPIMTMADIVCKIKTGAKISDAAPIEYVKNTKVPTLFIHGDADKLVPYEMMQRLYDASNAPIKEIWTVENAGHAMAKFQNPQIYFEHVFDFIDKYAK